jgi:hypothetical protein
MTKTTETAFSIDHLTLGEIAQLEDLSGQSLSQFSEDDAPKARFLTALAFLAKRREDSAYTFSQAEALTLTDLNAILDGSAPGEA